MKKIPLLLSALLLFGIGATQAQFTNLHNFQDAYFGDNNVIQIGNVLYGMTEEDGVYEDGNIYSINTDGTNYKDLYDFADSGHYAFKSSGDEPYGSLTLVGNTLFGVVAYGGHNSSGSVFSIHTDGTHYRDLWDFADSGSVSSNNYSGEYPYGSLVAVGHRLFGTTYYGGASGDGTIFSIDTAYSLDSARKGFKSIWSFNYAGDSNGAYPYYGALAYSSSTHKLYGATIDGGIHYDGNVYAIDTNGLHYKDLHDFSSCCSDGYNPYGSVVLSGGKLFGQTEDGGNDGDGTIFTVDTLGHNYRRLMDYNGYGNGEEPEQEVTISGTTIYAMADDYGFNDAGTLVAIDTAGNNYSVVFSFNEYTNGGYPYGNLFISGGKGYGTTDEGGTFDAGVLFSFDLCANFMITGTSTADNGTGTGTATATPSGSATPYTYVWSPGGQTTQTVTGLAAGDYTVTVSSPNGCQTSSTITVNSVSGINNLVSNAGINVYPNPNNGSFTIALSGTTDKATVEVYNMMGQAVYTGALATGNNTVELNTKASGVYLYRIISNTGNLVGQGRLDIQK